MNESMLSNTMLVLGIIMMILIINFFFRKYSRLLLWGEGLIAIVGTLFSIGIGWVKLFLPNGHPNFPVVTAVTIVISAGVLFLITTEKMNKHPETKETHTEETQEQTNTDGSDVKTDTEETQEQSIKGDSDVQTLREERIVDTEEIKQLPLKGKLDTPLAHIIFKKALESDLMSIEKVNDYRQHYQWKGTKVLLAYMCGRIYCGDTGMLTHDRKEILWKGGEKVFPSNDLDRLFNEKDLGQQRINRLDNRVPKDFAKVDQLFF